MRTMKVRLDLWRGALNQSSSPLNPDAQRLQVRHSPADPLMHLLVEIPHVADTDFKIHLRSDPSSSLASEQQPAAPYFVHAAIPRFTIACISISSEVTRHVSKRGSLSLSSGTKSPTDDAWPSNARTVKR